jgi:cell division protein FtsA
MASERIIAGLDIGTHTTQVVVAQKNDESDIIEVIGNFEMPSEGVRQGIIVDVDAASNMIRRAIEEVSKLAGKPVEDFFVSFGGVHIGAIDNVGSIIVSRADKVISQSEKDRVIQVARAITLPPNREILDTIPLYYIVDQDQAVRDPLGMTGTKLELRTLIVHGLTPHTRNWERAITDAGINTYGRVFTNIASARSVLSKNQKELGAAVLDIGGKISGLTVFEEGDIIHTTILPIGSSHITNDIAIGLQVDIDTAEKIKVEYGSLQGDASKKTAIDLSSHGYDVKVVRKELAHIVQKRLEELFDMVNAELKKIGKERMLPGGVVLVGGGAKLIGIVDFAKKQLGLPVQVGYPKGVEGVSEKIDDPAYTTAVGLVLLGFDEIMRTQQGKGFSTKIFKKIGQSFKRLLP